MRRPIAAAGIVESRGCGDQQGGRNEHQPVCGDGGGREGFRAGDRRVLHRSLGQGRHRESATAATQEGWTASGTRGSYAMRHPSQAALPLDLLQPADGCADRGGVALSKWDRFGHGVIAPGHHEAFPPLHTLKQLRKMRLGFECANFGHDSIPPWPCFSLCSRLSALDSSNACKWSGRLMPLRSGSNTRSAGRDRSRRRGRQERDLYPWPVDRPRSSRTSRAPRRARSLRRLTRISHQRSSRGRRGAGTDRTTAAHGAARPARRGATGSPLALAGGLGRSPI